MQATPLELKIRGMIAPSLEAMGYVLVRVRVRDGGRTALEVLAERKDDKGMSVDDCVEISHTVSTLLEVEDPITGPYDLEVSSPGVDRPLMSLEDFIRFTGNEAKVELMLAQDGRKRFRGVIERVEGNDITMRVDGVVVVLAFSNIRGAKLAMAEAQARTDLKRKKKV